MIYKSHALESGACSGSTQGSLGRNLLYRLRFSQISIFYLFVNFFRDYSGMINIDSKYKVSYKKMNKK